jgi:hypothetical protein
LGHGVKPADDARLASYGELADAPMKMAAGFMEMMSGPNAPNPQAVADKILELVSAPAGSRPQRAAVDFMMPQALDAINDTCAAVQKQIAAGFGH